MDETLVYLTGFAILALSSHQIGRFFSRIRLPMISGYLVAGVAVGPYGLDLIEADALHGLRLVDAVALAVIAFSAGGELYLAEMRSRLKSVAWIATGLVISSFVVATLTLLWIAPSLPFLDHLPPMGKIAVALLGGTVMVTRSPSSAIAIISELRAKGPFTKSVLGVIVVMDVVVIVLFALNSSLADAMLTGTRLDLRFLGLLVLEFSLAAALSWLLAQAIQQLLARRAPRLVKIAGLLVLGAATFWICHAAKEASAVHLPVEVYLEPLLICMVASFLVTNVSPMRIEFNQLLSDLAPPVFVAFFTLTGASLRLDVFGSIWPFTVLLVAGRVFSSFVGAFAGGVVAGDPMRYNRVAWMAYITQAGIGLGLAKEVADSFPSLGAEFTTLLVSAIVVNQFVGPPFFKTVIKRLRESHLPALATPDQRRDAVVLGIEGQSLALARQLRAHHWKVTLADTDAQSVEQLGDAAFDKRHLATIDRESLAEVLDGATDALVAMLGDDESNLRACEIAYEEYGVGRLIVRVNDASWTHKFKELGAMVVDPASAMVNLLDRFVRAPHTAELLETHQQYDTVAVTITDPDLVGLSLRDLRLPDDVLVLSIHRRRHWVVPHGYTRLRWQDEMTLVGSPSSLEEVVRRFGY